MAEDNTDQSILTTIKNFFSSLQLPEAPKEAPVNIPAGLDLSENVIRREYDIILKNETGWDRIKELFRYDETIGGRAPMLEENYDIVLSNCMMGFLLGSVIYTQQKNHAFKNDHQLTVYTNKKAATRAHVDFVFMQMLKGGSRIGFRFAGFTGMMVGGALLSEAYWHRSGPLDYSIGAAISGGLLTFDMGMSKFLMGSVIGSVFGAVFGLARHAQLSYGHKTYEDIRYEFYKKKIIQKKLIMYELESANKERSS